MRYKRPLLFLLMCSLSAASVVGCRRGGDTLAASASPQPAAKPMAVETTHAQTRDVWRVITLPGDIVPWEEATLYAKVPGTLDRILVDKGDRVRAGQLLAVIRAPELAADRAQAQQAFLSAMEAAQVSEATGRKTREEGRRAQITAEKVKADYAQAPASVERTKALLRQAEATLRRAKEQKAQADAALAEMPAQVQKAQADLDAARADQRFAELTYGRYNGIYTQDSKLIAKQQVDEAESKAKAAQSKTAAASSQLDALKQRIKAAQAQVNAAAQQVEEAQAGVQAAKDQVAIAEAQRDSMRKQVEVAGKDIDVSRRQQDVANAQAQQARFQAQAQRETEARLAAMADYANIRSPLNGIVTKRHVDRGAFIQTASTSLNAAPIVTVANLDTVRVDFHVPEEEAHFVRPGTPVEITAISLPQQTIHAKVSRTSGALDVKTRTMLAEVVLPNRGGILMPGTYVSAKISLENHPNVVSLPVPAVGVEKAGKFVFTVEGGKVKRVPVTTGFNDGKFIEVMEGLHGGEEVVVTGRDALNPGAAVTTTTWVPKSKK